MNVSRATQPISLIGAIVVGTLLIVETGKVSASDVPNTPPSVTTATLNGPSSSSVIGATGVVEVPGSLACAPSINKDAQFSVADQQVRDDAASAEAARSGLVHELLRLPEGPRSTLDRAFAEEDFEAERAELRAARRELTRAEQRIQIAACTPPEAHLTRSNQTADATVDVGMELPKKCVQPFMNGARQHAEAKPTPCRVPGARQ